MSNVFYGLGPDSMTDVTAVAIEKCMENNCLTIPIGDPERAELFGMDPYYGQLKSVFIVGSSGETVCYDHMTPVNIPDFV